MKTAPRSEHLLASRVYCKSAAQGVSHIPVAAGAAVPDMAQTYLVTATMAQYDLFLESDQVGICDLLEQEKTIYLVTRSAYDEIRARYSGYKWFQSKTSHFDPPRPAPTRLCSISGVGLWATTGSQGCWEVETQSRGRLLRPWCIHPHAFLHTPPGNMYLGVRLSHVSVAFRSRVSRARLGLACTGPVPDVPPVLRPSPSIEIAWGRLRLPSSDFCIRIIHIFPFQFTTRCAQVV